MEARMDAHTCAVRLLLQEWHSAPFFDLCSSRLQAHYHRVSGGYCLAGVTLEHPDLQDVPVLVMVNKQDMDGVRCPRARGLHT